MASLDKEANRDNHEVADLKRSELLEIDATRDLTVEEHNLGFREATRQYPWAVFWALFFGIAVIMAGFDAQIITSFYALPAFQTKYGEKVHGGDGYEVPAPWQTALGMGNPIGQILGALASGYPLEMFGRKKTLAFCCVWSIALVFVQFFSTSIGMLCAGEILGGLAYGFYVVIAPTYASEVCPLALRGFLTTSINMAFVIGQFIAQGCAAGVETRMDEWAYKIPFAIQWVWPAILLAGLPFAPESPYWLVRKGRREAARSALLGLSSSTNRPDIDKALVGIEQTDLLEQEIESSTSWMECFKRANLVRTEISVMVYLIQVIGGNPLIGYATYFFQKAGLDPSDAFNMGVGNTALGFTGTVLSWFLLNWFKLGRRTIYNAGMTVMTTLLFIIGFISISSTTSAAIWATATLMDIWTFVYQMTVGPICFVIISEISATRLREKTIAVATAVQAAASVVFTIVMPLMLNTDEANWGSKTAFLFGGISLVCLVWCYFRLPESQGRTFEELDILFQRRVPARQFKHFDLLNGVDNTVSRDSIPSTGLSVIYEPESDTPIVDIVMVHGLKGHPYKTWEHTTPSKGRVKKVVRPQEETSKPKDSKRLELRQSIRSLMSRSRRKNRRDSIVSDTSANTLSTIVDSNNMSVFWPTELLPLLCEKARILTFGYDTKITKYTSGPVNTNSIFSHGKDFLFCLGRWHVPGRRLIFVAHSLGGILVKEMLALSSTSKTAEHKDIVESTAAIIFLGTPHRGSPELSAIGEWARSILSTLQFQTAKAMLDALGLKTTDLQRTHEAFCRIWQDYDFQVKTFQESLGLTGIDLGVLGNKVVPHESSLIGDPREEAETLQANHLQMSRFSGAEDPNYIKVSGELRRFYTAIENAPVNGSAGRPELNSGVSNIGSTPYIPMDKKDLDVFLGMLQFDGVNTRRESILPPSANTTEWLFQNRTYNQWCISSKAADRLLFIKGKPGAGKSTLMKNAARHTQAKTVSDNRGICASFFVDAGGLSLQHSPKGIYQSLLCQLLPLETIWTASPDSPALRSLSDTIRTAPVHPSAISTENQLQIILMDTIEVLSSTGTPVWIFVDAVDELGPMQRQQVEFWRAIVLSNKFKTLRVCLSCRHFPNISVNGWLELVLDACNSLDILTYTRDRLEGHISQSEAHWRKWLERKITYMSSGVFLWVVLVLDDILAKYHQGTSLRILYRHIELMPTELEALYTRILGELAPSEGQLAERVFQWVFGATRPLKLNEWHHILAFMRPSRPLSLRQWRDSDDFTDSDEQLEREIKTLSKGLLEVSNNKLSEVSNRNFAEDSSVDVGAGSLDQGQGSSRVVRAIHQSVYDFFIHNQGFALFGLDSTNPLTDCHCTIANTCLNYILIPELDEYVIARQRINTVSVTTSSMHSFTPQQPQKAGTLKLNHEAEDTIEVLGGTLRLDSVTIVESWLARGDIPSYREVAPYPTSYCASHDSVDIASQALEDDPALLLYSITELPYHIDLAYSNSPNLDSAHLQWRLKDEALGQRLVALQQDKYERTKTIKILARLALNAAPLVPRTYTPDQLESQLKDQPEDRTEGRILSQLEGRIEDLLKRRQGPRRPRSIASFGSASSYSNHSHNSLRL
ncbi:unnamed protein product [Fusarium graminearum]|nr:unnamed protein product [Fusarium graminearum]